MAYFMDTWSILRSFVILYGHLVIVCGNLVYFFPFWYFVARKIWQPCCKGVFGWMAPFPLFFRFSSQEMRDQLILKLPPRVGESGTDVMISNVHIFA
jgi:hypothetical protein